MKLSKAEIIAESWRRGVLSWKLHPVQKELYNLYYTTTNKINVWLLGRRTGKSHALCVMAIESCLRNKNVIVKIVSPTKTQVDTNLRPLFKKILDDCPAQLKPRFVGKDYIYYFPNGSEIHLAGTDNGHAEKLRGSEAHIAIVDEAGSCDDLNNVVKNILLPSTLVTKGKIILASTPPNSYEHDFIGFIEDAEAKGTLIRKPSYTNPLITKEEMDLLIEELGGKNSDAYKREIECLIVKDDSLSVIPEFTPELEKEIIKEWVKPPFYDCYVSMDLGFKDLTGVLFGYYDFRNAKVVIEDELLLNFQETDVNLPLLVDKIKDKEFIHFTDLKTNEKRKPAARVSDLNPIVTQEIGRLSFYDINFTNANKQDKDAALNKLRVMLSTKKIIINPRCVNLIRQLRNVKWASKTNKKIFSRSSTDGHYDLLDAICYMITSIYYEKNPYPEYYQYETKDLFIKDPKNQQLTNNHSVESFYKMINMKVPNGRRK